MNSSVETIQAKHLNLALQVTLQVEYYDWPSALFLHQSGHFIYRNVDQSKELFRNGRKTQFARILWTEKTSSGIGFSKKKKKKEIS